MLAKQWRGVRNKNGGEKGRAVARFLRYWLEDTGEDPITRDPAVDADYDF